MTQDSAQPDDHDEDQPGAERPWLSDEERAALRKPLPERAVVTSLAFTGLVAAFMMTLVTPLVPTLPTILGVHASDSMWVVTATLLSAAVATPIAGRLGDLYGKRRMVLILLGIMMAGSVLAAFSSTIVPLIVARALQGMAMGVIPLGISILRDVLHAKRLGPAVALVSATLGIGGAVGLPISAVISQYLDWHVLFWVAGALGLIGFVLVARFVPVSTLRSEGGFDWIGAIGLAAGLVPILLAVSKGNEWGWTSVGTLSCLIGGVVVLLLWGWFEVRSSSPLVDLRIAARRTVLFTNLASITVGFAFFGSTVVLPGILEAPVGTGVGLGQNMLIASLCLMPSGLIMWAMSPVAARLTAAKGARLSLLIGITIIAVGYAIAIGLMTEVWHTVLTATAVGFGVGFAYAAMPTLIMGAVPPSETAASNGLNSVMRTLGSTIASAVIGAILASQVVTDGAVTTPSADAFRLSFAICAAAAVVGLVCTILLPRHLAKDTRSSLHEG
ncbi:MULTISPECIES: MFS transporter [Plantibacter]|uniref:Major Facilitator Superfamily protein n=1 Tax=Plantibacter cousiniae (nom. nud.) TaxID=199709 RepID=A0ABY1LMF0_9MICO|nr:MULTISPECIES: MFS transporter [Plantibacter]MDD9153217.1 MFS transporter [Plantibacter flavus]SKC61041.1 Major Facilitator Superfamily protein [Plantibacter cousiniae]